jgi:hypothetical protein
MTTIRVNLSNPPAPCLSPAVISPSSESGLANGTSPCLGSGNLRNTDYYRDLGTFLEEVDFIRNGPPNWLVDYYLDEMDSDFNYNQWQRLGPDITDGIQQDGDLHLQEYQEHLVHYHQLVPESFPWQEPHQCGPPIHSSYSQVRIPYHLLPLETTPGQESTRIDQHFGLDDLVPMIIGKKGCYLKRITEQSGLHYIWYNKDASVHENSNPIQDGVFELWGRQELLPYGAALLKTHIQKTIKNVWSSDYRNEDNYNVPYRRTEDHNRRTEDHNRRTEDHNRRTEDHTRRTEDHDSDYAYHHDSDQQSDSDDINLFNEVVMEKEGLPSLGNYLADWDDSELLGVIYREDFNGIYSEDSHNLTREEMVDIITDLLDYQRDPMAGIYILNRYRNQQDDNTSEASTDVWNKIDFERPIYSDSIDSVS